MFGMDVDPNEILEGLKGASDFEVLYPAVSACACSGSLPAICTSEVYPPSAGYSLASSCILGAQHVSSCACCLAADNGKRLPGQGRRGDHLELSASERCARDVQS
jgi:hypothetical protein